MMTTKLTITFTLADIEKIIVENFMKNKPFRPVDYQTYFGWNSNEEVAELKIILNDGVNPISLI